MDRSSSSRQRSPVFQVKLVLQNIPREDIDLPGLSFRQVVRPGAATAQIDLHWSFLESNDEIWLTLMRMMTPPILATVIAPENVTSVTGGDVSTDTGPVAVVPVCVAVHVTLSARPPPTPGR